MNYKYCFASVIGTSHKITNTAKQDNLCVINLNINDKDYFISAVADGAGRAKYSDRTSKFVCKFLTKKMTNWLKMNELSEFNKNIATSWIRQFQSILKRYMKIYKFETVKDFATTILFAVLSNRGNIFFQIGDGAISVGNDDNLKCVFKPQKGEYVNTTYFATQDNFEKYLMFEKNNDNIERFAMQTDGIETISLINYKEPSLAFFNPLFDCLRVESLGYSEDLSVELSEFLASDRVNKRTNDDKTLVIAMKAGNND